MTQPHGDERNSTDGAFDLMMDTVGMQGKMSAMLESIQKKLAQLVVDMEVGLNRNTFGTAFGPAFSTHGSTDADLST